MLPAYQGPERLHTENMFLKLGITSLCNQLSDPNLTDLASVQVFVMSTAPALADPEAQVCLCDT